MSTSTINMPKPLLVGSGLLLLLGLFLASGDPGKAERAQLIQAQADTQQHITALETKLTEQDTQIRQQNEAVQLSTRRVEASEENAARLRARVDEVERQLAAHNKAAALAASRAHAAAAKPAAIVHKAPAKVVVKHPAPQAKPTMKH